MRPALLVVVVVVLLLGLWSLMFLRMLMVLKLPPTLVVTLHTRLLVLLAKDLTLYALGHLHLQPPWLLLLHHLLVSFPWLGCVL
jgi:hypothetical protein